MGTSLLQQGLNLTLYGMGAVLAFLTLLVIATALMSACVRRFFPADQFGETLPQQADSPVDAHTLKVIQQAIDQHLGRH